jgi:nucleoside-diphosphate-sugar epimerase
MGLRVLVTGGAGYLGSVLTRHLLNRGYRVTILDSLIYHQNQTGVFQYCYHKDFEFVYADARDEAILLPLLAHHDIIIPLAAIVGAPACDRDPQLAESVNFGAIELLNRLRSPMQLVIYPSTNSGYGTTTGELHCTEETPLEPISLYGSTKVRAERLLLNSQSVMSLRLATLFGVSQRMRLDLLVNNFTYRALKDHFLVLYEAYFKRSCLHVEDAARAFCHCIEHFADMQGEAYNVGLEEANLSKLELAEKIKEHVPELYIHCAEVGTDPDRRNYVTSYDRIGGHGFETCHSLDEGIEQLLKAFRMIQLTGWGNAHV